jgi:DNA polymerase-3 subunit gamma/tau
VSNDFPDNNDGVSGGPSDGAEGVADVPAETAAGGHAAAVAHASAHENPTDSAESLGTGLGDHATGDIVIDSALQDLQNAPQDDLDAQIDAGQRVQQTLQARLSDLGGE